MIKRLQQIGYNIRNPPHASATLFGAFQSHNIQLLQIIFFQRLTCVSLELGSKKLCGFTAHTRLCVTVIKGTKARAESLEG